MTTPVRVSTIIPTYNRRELVQRAIDSVLAQTLASDEIIVVDDGSTDGTDDALRARYGGRIVYRRQGNAGVSAARNLGLAIARGQYLALLDSDDLWHPEKTARQVAFLDAHADYGMVVCDVARVDEHGAAIDVFRRRDVLPRDGWVLGDVLMNPALAPASAMFRRQVYETVGGFDPGLRTAEDLDFHLRVAREWRIGVVEETLVTAMRGDEGLSGMAHTYDDYVRVMERAVAASTGALDGATRNRALAATYTRNARGMLLSSRWRDGARLAAKAFKVTPGLQAWAQACAFTGFAVRRIASAARRR